MVFSYIGLGEPIKLINKILLSSIADFRRNNDVTSAYLKPGGVFGSDLGKCASFAAENDMAVYLSAGDVIRKSDIIFTFLPDKALKGLAQSLSGHGVENKIFCHFSPAFDASVLDFGGDNTYASFYIPALPKHFSSIDDMPLFIVEGYGDKFEEICTIMRIMNLSFQTVNFKEKQLLISAMNLVGRFRSHIEDSAQRLIKIALHSSPEGEQIFESVISGACTPVTYDPTDTSDAKFAECQRKALMSLGIKDVSAQVGAMLLSGLYSKPQTDSSYSAIKTSAMKLLGK